MGDGGVDQTSGRDLHHVAAGGGMVDRVGGNLQQSRDDFYHYSEVETVIRGGGLCTTQRSANGLTGGTSPG